MPQFDTVDAYADHIRIQTGRIMSALFSELGTSHPQALAVAALHEEAANVLTGREMQQEQQEIEALDLAKLPLPAFVESRGEADPYRDE